MQPTSTENNGIEAFDSLTLRRVTTSDHDIKAFMSLFDRRIEWLNASKGIHEHWGREPWSQTRGTEPAEKILKSGDPAWFVLDTLGDEMKEVAALMIGSRMPYVTFEDGEKAEEELYLKVLVVDPAFSGKNIGGRLIGKAKEEARKQCVKWLRIDCFRGDPEQGKDGLVKYYERMGFERVRPFVVGEKENWTGMLMQMRM